jgi:MFS family permease
MVQGAAMSAMMPARQAMTPEVVGMHRLMNAIALNTSGMNFARLVMPGVAGFALGALGGGEGIVEPAKWVYFATAALYLWAVIGLTFVRVPDRQRERSVRSGPLLAYIRQEIGTGMHELWMGAVYIAKHPVIRMLLAANVLMVFFSMTYFNLLPGFAKDVLDAGPSQLGYLISISGIGSLAGSLVVASLPDRNRGMLLLCSALLLGVGLIAFSASTHYWLSAAILTVVGVGQSGRMSISNILIQSYTEEEYRGRVNSIYMMEFSLISFAVYGMGLLANALGPQLAFGLAGVGMVLLATGLLLFVPSYRKLE